MAKQATSEEGTVTLGQTLSDVTTAAIPGKVLDVPQGSTDIKIPTKDANRLQRIANNNPTSGNLASAKNANAKVQQIKIINVSEVNLKTVKGETLENALQTTSNKVILAPPEGNNNIIPPPMIRNDNLHYSPKTIPPPQ